MKIVILDANPISLNIQKNMLKERFSNQLTVIEAADANAVLKICLREDIRMIILDWNLLQTSKSDLLKQIRAIPEYEKVAILVFCDENNTAQFYQAIEAGATNYLVKPIKEQFYIEKISKYLVTNN